MAFTGSVNAPLPTTTKGDLVVHNGTKNVRLPVGLDGEVLTADSSSATGLSYIPIGAVGGSDYQSGVTLVNAVETVTIQANRQSIVYGQGIEVLGTLDVIGTLILINGNDEENFSYDKIASGNRVVIPENQQMLVNSVVDVDGVLEVNGKLIIFEV